MKVKFALLSALTMVSMFLLMSSAGTGTAHSQDSTPTPHSMSDMTDAPLSAETARLIADVRAETASFRTFDGIEKQGYGKFLDCFVNKEAGAMGQHFVNGDLVGDDVLDPMKPEALVYEPTKDGQMILVAYEYLVFADKWDPNNTGRAAPTLYGHEFHLKTTIPDTPPVWTLHLWLWTSNPNGEFADWNPTVFCPSHSPVTDMTPKS